MKVCAMPVGHEVIATMRAAAALPEDAVAACRSAACTTAAASSMALRVSVS